MFILFLVLISDRLISMHTAVLTIKFDTKEQARIVYESLLPELSKKIPQTNCTVTLVEQSLILSLRAHTTAVLRAALNSYGRWIQTAMNVEQIADH